MVFGGRVLGAGEGLAAAGVEAGDLLVGGFEAGLDGVDPSGQAGEALAAVGDGTQRGAVGLLRGGVLLLGAVAAQRGIGERLVGGLGLPAQALLLDPHVGRLCLERLGVAAADVERGLVLSRPHALGGDRDGGGDPLAEPGQRVPLLLGRVEVCRGGTEPALGRLLCRLRIGDGLLGAGLRGLGGCLVGKLGLQLGLRCGEVVGQEAGLGVAQFGLDDGGLASSLGLAAEGFQLALQLSDQILEALQVGIGGFELP